MTNPNHQVNYTSLPPDENTSNIIYLQMERDVTRFVPQCDTVDILLSHVRWAIHSSRFEVLKLCASVTKLAEMGRVNNRQELLNENPLCKQRLGQPICLNCVCNMFSSFWAIIKVFNRKCRSTRRITHMIICQWSVHWYNI